MRPGRASGTSVAYDAGMTSTPSPDPAAVSAPRAVAVTPSGEGVDVVPEFLPQEFMRLVLADRAWFLAVCRRCSPDLGQPFRDEGERDVWAARHTASTGHVVSMSIDGPPILASLHVTGVLARVPVGPGESYEVSGEPYRYRWVCPADDCGTSVGSYETPDLAIAAWRTHRPGQESM